MLASAIRLLANASYLLGGLIVAGELWQFSRSGSRSALCIALCIVIVGPLEDWLAAWVKEEIPLRQRAYCLELVNQVTSLAFLILLGLVASEIGD